MLELDRISKTYRIGTFGGTELHAVRDVSFTLERGEVISLIGESGSGKSTIGRMILRLLAPSAGARPWFHGDEGSACGRLGPDRVSVRQPRRAILGPFSRITRKYLTGS